MATNSLKGEHMTRYEYKFVIDGNVWRRDPNNEARAGVYRNSVIDVGK